MKRYTSESQTAKLIELGFEKPKSISGYCRCGPYEYDAETNTKMVVYDDTQYPIYAYSIGELIEMLPERIEGEHNDYLLAIEKARSAWWVMYLYLGKQKYATHSEELADALYDMLISLKEEGVI